MDNVFNKLRSTLINTVGSAVGNTAQVVSQVSHALPGNNVTKEYEVVKHIASAGPGESQFARCKIEPEAIYKFNLIFPRPGLENLFRFQEIDQARSRHICLREAAARSVPEN
jgi:hypothetical protein